MANSLMKTNRTLLRFFLLMILWVAPCLLLGAQTKTTATGRTAVFGALSGKVELREEAGGAWTPAKTGMTIKPGAMIATGIRAKAVVTIGQTTLTVSQLTRMTLEELVEKQGTLETGLFLRHGQVEAEVKGTEGLKHNFKLRSAVSTAAVRGTHFIFTPFTLVVKEGLVHYLNRLGQMRSVAAGEKSRLVAFYEPQTARESKEEASTCTPFTSGTATGINTSNPPKAKVTLEFAW